LGTWLSPVHYARAYGEFRQGKEGVSPATRHRGTLTQVEPRMSMTAANADRWVYIKPGYEGLLALSIAQVLLTEHADRVDGAIASASDLADFAPDRVAASTGVSAARITELARELADNPRSLVIGGGSAAAHTNGLFNLKAIYTLNYLLGSVGKEGGVLFNPPSPIAEAPSVSSFGMWQGVVNQMRDGGVDLFMVRRANPSHGLPKALDFNGALQNVDTVVSFSSFMDETTVMADLILPEPTYLETWGDDVPDPGPGYQTVTLQQPVVKPFAEADTRPFVDVLLTAAAKLGNDAVSRALPWRNMEDVLRENAWKLHDKNSGSVRGGTREEFWNAVLQRGGWWDSSVRGSSDPGTSPKLPTRVEEPEFEGPTGGDTFHLVPFSSLSLGEGQGANLPWLQATPDPMTTAVWHTWAEINPNRADEMDIREGDVLEIEASGRTMRALAYVNPTTPPDVIAVVFGQGHQVYGNFEIGDDLHRSLVGKERGANVFDVLAQRVTRIGGRDDALAWAATRVKVTKTNKWTRLSKLEGTVLPVALPGQPIVQVTGPQ
ncbi:MAG: molybdopterin-dependent oxidoreductase, partial [Chloroflexi bacterium]|nr:molybdopterin-dependent oxidoreductase [Chloroflexota bacterium]